MQHAAPKRWMVGLDFSAMDQTLVQYVNFLSKVVAPEKIYFIHAEKNLDIPEYIPDEWKPAAKVIDEGQRTAMQEVVANNFDDSQPDLQYEVIEGKPLDTVIHWAEIKNIDLFIAGNKEKPKGHGILPHKLSRKLACDTLLVPEISSRSLQKILVPIDFSEHSETAVSRAVSLAENVPGSTITCVHTYRVPIGYYKTGKNYELFARVMKESAGERFESFIKPYGRSIECIFALQTDETTPELISKEAQKHSADLLMVGSRGLSRSSLILMGSTTEKLIRMDGLCPIWVVKDEIDNQ